MGLKVLQQGDARVILEFRSVCPAAGASESKIEKFQISASAYRNALHLCWAQRGARTCRGGGSATAREHGWGRASECPGVPGAIRWSVLTDAGMMRARRSALCGRPMWRRAPPYISSGPACGRDDAIPVGQKVGLPSTPREREREDAAQGRAVREREREGPSRGLQSSQAKDAGTAHQSNRSALASHSTGARDMKHLEQGLTMRVSGVRRRRMPNILPGSTRAQVSFGTRNGCRTRLWKPPRESWRGSRAPPPDAGTEHEACKLVCCNFVTRRMHANLAYKHLQGPETQGIAYRA